MEFPFVQRKLDQILLYHQVLTTAPFLNGFLPSCLFLKLQSWIYCRIFVGEIRGRRKESAVQVLRRVGERKLRRTVARFQALQRRVGILVNFLTVESSRTKRIVVHALNRQCEILAINRLGASKRVWSWKVNPVFWGAVVTSQLTEFCITRRVYVLVGLSHVPTVAVTIEYRR